MFTKPTVKIPSNAAPKGDYVLDIALEMLREHWRNGRQIVPLIGAGISSESGFPVILKLREHLLALHVMQQNEFKWPGENSPKHPSYSLERDGWVSPTRLSERLPHLDQEEQLRHFLKETFIDRAFWKAGSDSSPWLETLKGQVIKALNKGNLDRAGLIDMAEILNLGWLELMEKLANHRPELVDMIFDALGAYALPGPTHNLLTHCVSWFNIRLLLTTNFDSLTEKSLESEGMKPYSYDVHLRAEPPQKVLVQQHLSVIKLHGSHYGIRADHSVNQPIDRGHLATLLDYLDDDVVLLCLGYGGAENRITGFIDEVLKHKPQARMVRVDPIAPGANHFFVELARTYNQQDKRRPRIVNLYYPPSTGQFLLHLYQYVANRMPNTRGRYPSAVHMPAPHKHLPTFGCDACWTSCFGSQVNGKRIEDQKENREHEAFIGDNNPDTIVQKFKDRTPYQVVRTSANGGTSQVLAQVYEKQFRDYQIAWCDLDDVTSVGAVMGWLYDFVNSRQPDVPKTPLPIALPVFELPLPNAKEKLTPDDVRDLDRAVRHLWSRLAREKFVVVLDSLSSALELESLGGGVRTERSEREAARLVLLLACLMKYADNSKGQSQCTLLIGTHPLKKETGDALDTYLTHSLKDEVHEMFPLIEASLIWEKVKKLIGPKEEWRTDDDLISYNITQIRDQDDESNKDNIREAGYSNYPQRDWVWEVAEEPKLWHVVVEPDLSDKKSTDLKHLLEQTLEQFLLECAWCNRSRSWRQLIQLPSVKKLGIMIKDEKHPDPLAINLQKAIELQKKWIEKGHMVTNFPTPHPSTYLESLANFDPRSRALHILVNGAMRRKKLFLQAGGFYYMDGIDRANLRKRPKDKAIQMTHQRLADFFERTYNQSGDVTALSHYFWHMHEIMEIYADQNSPSVYWQTIEKCVFRLLENSMPSRESLYAYDHCFLLLQLYDIVKERKMLPDVGGERTRLDKDIADFERRILNALCEIYEENLDTQSGEYAAQKSKRLTHRSKHDRYDKARAHFRAQKAQWQGMKLTESFKSAHHALIYLLKDKETADSERRRVNQLQEFPLVLDMICAQIGLQDLKNEGRLNSDQVEEYRQKVQDNYREIEITAHRVLFHRVSMRTIRSLIRVARFATCTNEGSPNQIQVQRQHIENLIEVLLAFGNDLNIGDSPTSSQTKTLTARYLSAAGLYAIYGISATSKEGAGLKMTYYNHQSQARSIRAEGGVSKIYEANTFMDEAEMLLWRARITLGEINKGDAGNKVKYDNATARQLAAVRYLDSAHLILLEGTVSLASWLEMTVQRSAITADILKRITCQYLDLGSSSTLIETLEAQVKKLKRQQDDNTDTNRGRDTTYTALWRNIPSTDAELRRSTFQKLEDTEKRLDTLREGVVKTRKELTSVHQKKLLLLAEFAQHTEQAAFELGYLLPLIRDETWRGARAGIQMFRIAGYICHMLREIFVLNKEIQKADPSFSFEGTPLLVSLETLVRAINIIDLGRPSPLQTLPRVKNGADRKAEDAEFKNFELQLWMGVAEWVGHIDGWLMRILPLYVNANWSEFEGARKRFDQHRTYLKKKSIGYDTLMQVENRASLDIHKNFLATLETEEVWDTAVYRWSDAYIE